MLDPDARALLLESLRPPIGMHLDRGVATTFTLDLRTALTVPLALAGFSLSGPPDVIAMMESLRSTAARVDMFAQAGMLTVAQWPGDLAALLETSIHTVRRPRPGLLFHPKCWVLRFASPDGDIAHRCIVTSRNITADCSWDVILRLDSDPESTRVNAGNDGLRRLLEALPQMVDTPLDGGRRDGITELADELRRVSWQLPDGVDHISFSALGVPGGRRRSAYRSMFHGYRHLLISPFISPEGVATLIGDSPSTQVSIVGRADELDCLAANELADTEVLTLDPLAGLGGGFDDDATPALAGSIAGDLHAKVYVVEANRRCRVYVGSANATHAAFHGNVEILCELDGRVKELGVDTMLGPDAPFRDLLVAYSSPPEPTVDPEGEAGHKLDAILIDVAEAGFTITLAAEGDGWSGVITSRQPIPDLPATLDVRLDIAPYNRAAEISQLQPGQHTEIAMSARPAADHTAFLVVTAEATIGGRRLVRSCVVRATMVGAPAERLDDVLVRQLDTPEKFLRFLMLLMAIGDGSAAGRDAGEGDGSAWEQGVGTGLLELMVRSLAVNPGSIDRVASLIERLMESPHGAEVLPAGWHEVWPTVRAARRLVEVGEVPA